jgi:hypothetical protein
MNALCLEDDLRAKMFFQRRQRERRLGLPLAGLCERIGQLSER